MKRLGTNYLVESKFDLTFSQKKCDDTPQYRRIFFVKKPSRINLLRACQRVHL